MALSRIKPDGSLELANTFSYATWGQPTIRFDHPNSAMPVSSTAISASASCMSASFIQPDPDRSEANLYAYAANNPVTEIDPDGTCFIVCVIIGAVVDTAVYLATTDSSQWNVGDAAGAVVSGAVESAVNPFAKIGKVTKLVSAAQKVYTKFSKAGRVAKKVSGKVFGGSRASQAGQIRIPGARPNLGRSQKQERLRQLMNDDKAPRHVRGWLKQDQNLINKGRRQTLRVPPGYQLAHGATTPARRGFSYT